MEIDVPENPLSPLDGAFMLSPFIHISLRKDVFPGHHVPMKEQKNEIADDLNLDEEVCIKGQRSGLEATASRDKDACKDEEVTTEDVEFPLLKRELTGRRLGDDYSKLNGFSMYGGRAIPGFPDIKLPPLPCNVFIIHFVIEGTVDLTIPNSELRARLGGGDLFWRHVPKREPIEWSEMYPPLSKEVNPSEILQMILIHDEEVPAKQNSVIWHENNEWEASMRSPMSTVANTISCAIEGVPLELEQIRLGPTCDTALQSDERAAFVIVPQGSATLTINGESIFPQKRSIAFPVTENRLEMRNTSSDCEVNLIVARFKGSKMPTEVEYNALLQILKASQEAAEKEAPELGPFSGEEWTYVEETVDEAKLVMGLTDRRSLQRKTEQEFPPAPNQASRLHHQA